MPHLDKLGFTLWVENSAGSKLSEFGVNTSVCQRVVDCWIADDLIFKNDHPRICWKSTGGVGRPSKIRVSVERSTDIVHSYCGIPRELFFRPPALPAVATKNLPNLLSKAPVPSHIPQHGQIPRNSNCRDCEAVAFRLRNRIQRLKVEIFMPPMGEGSSNGNQFGFCSIKPPVNPRTVKNTSIERNGRLKTSGRKEMSAPDCRMRPYPQHRRDRRADSKAPSGSDSKSKQMASNPQSNILMPTRPQQRCQYPKYDSKLGIPYITMYLHFRPLDVLIATGFAHPQQSSIFFKKDEKSSTPTIPTPIPVQVPSSSRFLDEVAPSQPTTPSLPSILLPPAFTEPNIGKGPLKRKKQLNNDSVISEKVLKKPRRTASAPSILYAPYPKLSSQSSLRAEDQQGRSIRSSMSISKLPSSGFDYDGEEKDEESDCDSLCSALSRASSSSFSSSSSSGSISTSTSTKFWPSTPSDIYRNSSPFPFPSPLPLPPLPSSSPFSSPPFLPSSLPASPPSLPLLSSLSSLPSLPSVPPLSSLPPLAMEMEMPSIVVTDYSDYSGYPPPDPHTLLSPQVPEKAEEKTLAEKLKENLESIGKQRHSNKVPEVRVPVPVSVPAKTLRQTPAPSKKAQTKKKKERKVELNLNLNLGFNLGLGSGDGPINGSGGGSKEIGCVSRRSVGVQTDPISELDLGSGSTGMLISSSPSSSPSKIKGKRKGRDVLSPKYLRRGRSAVDLDVDEVSTTNAAKADVLGSTSASLDKEKVQPEEGRKLNKEIAITCTK